MHNIFVTTFTSIVIMTTTGMSCDLVVIQYPYLVSAVEQKVLHLQTRQWHVSKLDALNYHRGEFHVRKCIGSASLLEYTSAHDFVEFDQMSK